MSRAHEFRGTTDTRCVACGIHRYFVNANNGECPGWRTTHRLAEALRRFTTRPRDDYSPGDYGEGINALSQYDAEQQHERAKVADLDAIDRVMALCEPSMSPDQFDRTLTLMAYLRGRVEARKPA